MLATSVPPVYKTPEGTFLHSYMQFMQAMETPTRFDLFGGLFLLSAVLDRRATIARPNAPLNTNLFTLFVADSGIARKSTAVGYVERILDQFCAHTGFNLVRISARATTAGIADAAAEHSFDTGTRLSFVSTEMVNLLGRKSSNTDLPALLTELYDCPATCTGALTGTAGWRHLREVYCTFLSAAAPSWLVRAINPDVLEGGFASRLLVVSESMGKGLRPWTFGDLPANTFTARSVQQLEQVRNCLEQSSDVLFSTRGVKKYVAWYKNRVAVSGPYLAAFQSREQDHVLRIAALLAINDRSWLIEPRHLSPALAIVSRCREDGFRVFAGSRSSQEIAFSDRLYRNVDSLMAYLTEQGGEWTQQATLINRFKNTIKSEGLMNILDVLLYYKAVQHIVEQTKGRPRRLWRGTTALHTLNVQDICARIDRSRA